jgi:putative iron-dependent peroxidase
MVQRYQHDLVAWNALTVEEQQRAIGRDKLSNAELPDEDTPASAHRVLTSITDDSGRELAIVRDNMPFGSPAAGEACQVGTFDPGRRPGPGSSVGS